MKIGIDCRMLGKGFGLARHQEQLVRHLAKIETDNTFVLFLCKENWDAVHLCKESCERNNSLCLPSSKFSLVLADIPWYGLAEQLKFPRVIKKANIDLMHFPHFNVPMLYRGPFVVTIHDLTMFHFPRPEASTRGKLLFWLKDKVHRYVIRSAAKRATRIITTSEYTKHDIHNTLDIPLAKMTTVYQAPFGAQHVEHIDLAALGIQKPFALYVGAAYPHKNVETLLEAWREIDDIQLVLVGKRNYFYDRLLRRIEAEGMKHIVYTNFLPDEELVGVYKEAEVFLFPSLYEGFGLPPLEAQAFGTPVISADRASLPEILGEGAMYIDALSPSHIVDTVCKLFDNPDVAHELRQRGRENVQRFSWKRFAQQVNTIYNQQHMG